MDDSDLTPSERDRDAQDLKPSPARPGSDLSDASADAPDAPAAEGEETQGPIEPAPIPPGGVDPLQPGAILSLETQREDALSRAGAELRAGGLIVVPTDTVYGIAANAFDKRATAAVFAAKNRPRSLPLPVLVSRPRQAWALCSHVPAVATELAAEFWPGGLTLVLPATELDWDLGDSDGTIALRIPAHRDLIDLMERVGPIACTSANITGEPTPATAHEIKEKLGDKVGIYLDGGPAAGDSGSTIVDCSGSAVRVIREGPITVDQVREIALRAG